ncbi:MAG TPA: amidoligase family protein [Geopsychrobacteraceae bacterium]|nr:amidoligase family protein [Geopsychrobacteraceae bacterium]
MFKLPIERTNGDGQLRSVGFELEFTGLTISEASQALHKALGGTLRITSLAESVLHVDGLGEFRIELDWKYIKTKAAEEGKNKPSQWIELLGQSAALLVPLEIVCPPLPLDKLDALTPMVSALREAGATGTEDSIIAAFGVHINVEIPLIDAAHIHSYLRAFALLQWWLVDNNDINLTRKISPYIDLYPEAYLEQLCNKKKPTLNTLIDDYLKYNVSRNRALDMLPLLAEINPERVQSVLGDDLIQARPAFHYRLPDCHIEKPDWSLNSAWESWLIVELLATQTETLERLTDQFLTMSRPLLGVSRKDWTKVIDQWYRNHMSA